MTSNAWNGGGTCHARTVGFAPPVLVLTVGAVLGASCGSHPTEPATVTTGPPPPAVWATAGAEAWVEVGAPANWRGAGTASTEEEPDEATL